MADVESEGLDGVRLRSSGFVRLRFYYALSGGGGGAVAVAVAAAAAVATVVFNVQPHPTGCI